MHQRVQENCIIDRVQSLRDTARTPEARVGQTTPLRLLARLANLRWRGIYAINCHSSLGKRHTELSGATSKVEKPSTRFE